MPFALALATDGRTHLVEIESKLGVCPSLTELIRQITFDSRKGACLKVVQVQRAFRCLEQPALLRPIDPSMDLQTSFGSD